MTELATHSLLERIAQGAPLLVLVCLILCGMFWRKLENREKYWDDRSKTWEDRLRAEADARERMMEKVTQTVTINTEAQKEHTAAIRGLTASNDRLTAAIEERRP